MAWDEVLHAGSHRLGDTATAGVATGADELHRWVQRLQREDRRRAVHHGHRHVRQYDGNLGALPLKPTRHGAVQ